MQPHYYPELMRIRSFLERTMGGFPSGKCYKTAKIVAELVPDLDVAVGYFCFGGERVSDHGWNLDRNRKLIVDLTLDQFGSGYGRVNVLPADSENFEQILLMTLRANTIAVISPGEYKPYVQAYKDVRSGAFSRAVCGIRR
jgi:hypothetical protein